MIDFILSKSWVSFRLLLFHALLLLREILFTIEEFLCRGELLHLFKEALGFFLEFISIQIFMKGCGSLLL
jgi:hypothetical protein